jgi:hypothetical protein
MLFKEIIAVYIDNLMRQINTLGGQNIELTFAHLRKEKILHGGRWSIWRLKGLRGNTDKGVYPICRKKEGGSHILQCDGTRVWKDRQFTSVHPEIGTKKIASNKMRDNWTKTAQCLIKYKQNGKGQLKRVMIK